MDHGARAGRTHVASWPGVREEPEERAAIARLERALGTALEPRQSGLPADGPAKVWAAPGVIAWAASAARIRAELEGIERGRGHPCAPRVLAHDASAIALEAIERDPEPLDAIIEGAPSAQRIETEATIREHLDAIGGEISLPRAIARIVGRSRADRVLSRTIRIATGVGPILGGIHPAWIHRAADRACSLSMRHARAEGWRAIDLAAGEVHGIADSRAAHGASEEEGAAYDLAVLALTIREAVVGRDRGATDRARETIERLVPRDPARVSVRIAAPAFVDLRAREGDDIAPAAARETLRLYDGLAVGGARIAVEVTPAIRAGRAAPMWRPRAERRRELFALWDRGIRTDDEGLFSATPQAIAERIAEGARGVVLDGTCGIGSIAIALARRSEVTRVIAVDVDARRLEMTRHNAEIYGVRDRIELVHGDVRDVAARASFDRLVLDPPWGGREYDRERMTLDDLGLDLRPLLASFDGPVVIKLPRSFDVGELPGFALEAAMDPRGVIKLLIARRG
jgi:16S rRNA G966 N2-methylase RsmD